MMLDSEYAAIETERQRQKQTEKERSLHLSSSILPSQASKISIKIITFSIFLQSVADGLILPSLWFLMKDRDLGMTTFGVIVCCYGMGHMIAYPLSQLHHFLFFKNTRTILFAFLSFSLAGSVTYFFYDDIPNDVDYYLAGSRFLSGVGSVIVSASRNYITSFVTYGKKLKPLYLMSLSQVIGVCIGSGLCWMVSYGTFSIGGLKFDSYSLPAAISSLLFVANLILLLFVHLAQIPPPTDDEADDEGLNREQLILETLCFIIWFCVYALFSVFETLTTIITDTEFGWSERENAALFFLTALIATPVFTLYYKKGRKRFFHSGHRHQNKNNITSLNQSSSMKGNLNNSINFGSNKNISTVSPVADNDRFLTTNDQSQSNLLNNTNPQNSQIGDRHDSCSEILIRFLYRREIVLVVSLLLLLLICGFMYVWPNEDKLTEYQFLIAWALFAAIWPIAVFHSYLSYAHLIPFAKRAHRMFWLSLAGLLARVVTPLWSTYVFDNHGARIWIYLSGHMFVGAICGMVLFFKLKKREETLNSKKISQQVQQEIVQRERQERERERDEEEIGLLKGNEFYSQTPGFLYSYNSLNLSNSQNQTTSSSYNNINVSIRQSFSGLQESLNSPNPWTRSPIYPDSDSDSDSDS